MTRTSAFGRGFPSNGAKIKTGSYTGDGSLSQSITGVGFRPKAVWVQRHVVAAGNNYEYEKTDRYAGDLCFAHYPPSLAGGHTQQANALISLDVDGFTVDDAGADWDPNANGVTYDYLALG